MPRSKTLPDRSEEQTWVVSPKAADATTPENWGMRRLAVPPRRVESNRERRAGRPVNFDDLPDSASTMFEDLERRLEQHVGANDLVPAYWLEQGAARSRTVCKVDASGQDYRGRSGAWSGTGFLVAPGILCTNHHVINSRDVADRARALFDFAATPEGGVRKVATYALRPDTLFWTSPVVEDGGLDVTFVAVEGDPGETFGSNQILRQSFAAAEMDKLNIVQHPGGRLKEVALRDNTLVFQDARVVHYRSDTETGSSGAPVYNDAWELLALHHAASPDGNANEGIKFSAITCAIEQDAERGDTHARQIMEIFRGTDELMGFFGALGREVNAAACGLERVADAYEGGNQDLDIGFWNVEWFNRRWQDKLDAVARVVIEMNLDVWVFVESSEEATRALAEHLAANYAGTWEVLASQDATSSQQITTVLWNTATVSVAAKPWPETVRRWLDVDSRAFGELGLEAVHGRVFDRYPARYEISVEIGGTRAAANLVPVHLKARDEGSLRRRMAARLLAEAIAEVSRQEGEEGDWIIGGDFNATLDSGDLDALADAGLLPMSARDAQTGQITYVKAPYASLIDHVYVSPNLAAVDDEDFVIVALDRSIDRFLDVSDHRPILLRLAANPQSRGAAPPDSGLSEEERGRLVRGLAAGKPARAGRPGRTEQGTDQPYYDAGADGVARDAYWADTNPESADFTQRVRQILRDTHTQPLSYKPSTHLYPWVDLRPNGKVRSIYSGFEADPEFFIAADLEMDRRRESARETLRSGGLEMHSDGLEALLEAEFAYNCEHVVPQSWFNKREPMRGDLHHLFACEPRCNSFRSNFPYAAHELERTMEDCGRVEDQTFEPKGGKGAVARATLYFLLRYGGTPVTRYAGEGLDTLLAWHAQFAPDEWEHHRNAAIQAMQGNRNPLIDHPVWADALVFDARERLRVG